MLHAIQCNGIEFRVSKSEVVVIKFVGDITGVTTMEGWLRVCGQTLAFNELTGGKTTTADQAWKEVLVHSPSLPVALFGRTRSSATNGTLDDLGDLIALSGAHVERHNLDAPAGFWPPASPAELTSMFGESAVRSVLPTQVAENVAEPARPEPARQLIRISTR